ncbi:MAG: DMT family transporter [Thalassobaculaceae bacterium]|nr:DMT family transporter [Thalassobaculaceae bacterium]
MTEGVGVPFDYVPLMLATTAALLFAIGSQWQNIGLATIDGRTGAMVSITAAAGTLWLAAPFFMTWSYWLEPAVLIFVAIGLFRPALSANLAVAGMRYLGPTLVSTLASTSPLFGTAMGVLILGEMYTLPLAIGTGGIVVAVLLLSKRGKVKVDWPFWALLLPVGAAFLRALGHVLSKIGMESGIPDPYFAGLVGFTVSTVLTWSLRGVRREPVVVNWRAPGVKWFALGGATMAAAICCLNTGLLRGDLVVIAPIVASSPIFTMLLSALVFHREKLTPKVIVATFIVVGSVIVIALGR